MSHTAKHLLRIVALTASTLAVTSPWAQNAPYINGGIGRGEVRQIEGQEAAFNLHLTFSEGPSNAYVTNVVLRIADGRGRTVLALDDAGPLTNVKLPPGTYSVSTRYGSHEKTQKITVPAGKPVELNLHYPQGPQAAGS
jgi:hypothetical protein